MAIFVTSDHHFGHANIIKLCNRPFKSVEAMDQEMIRQWNSVVKPEDTVYHLGDFAWRKGLPGSDLLRLLNGSKHLIKGNHDPKINSDGWTSVQDYYELPLGDGQFAILSHYRMEDWHGQRRGNVMLHGHSHGSLNKRLGTLDVGVDSIGFTPLELTEAVSIAREE